MLGFGFGFVEVGTLTPRAQPGNPRPRAFRLLDDRAVINRYGFNNEGHAPALARLSKRARRGIVGVNIGANKDAGDRVADYVAGVSAFADVASYFTINVSSPNTPGLRDLQEPAALSDLLARVIEARDAAPVRRPLLLKIAPDLTLDAARRHRARRARSAHRRHDRVEHDDFAAPNAALAIGEGERRTIGRAAVRPLDAHARANIFAR